jgi:lysozyme family protein
MTDNFNIAFNRTMKIEGERILTKDRLDPGGETFSGISRRFHPSWAGWPMIDSWKAGGRIDWSIIDKLTRDFYKERFWDTIQGDKIANISPEIAYELFDTGVNLNTVRAVEFMQTAHNVAAKGEYELLVDGILGPKTIETISRYISTQPGTPELNTEILLNCMNGEQYIFYKNNPMHKEFRGWFTRLSRLSQMYRDEQLVTACTTSS